MELIIIHVITKGYVVLTYLQIFNEKSRLIFDYITLIYYPTLDFELFIWASDERQK